MDQQRLGRRDAVVLVVIGLVAGVLAGYFGIGGGTVIVPGLVLLGFSQRRAVATSLAAIGPTAVAASIAYIAHHQVDWLVAGLLIVGVVVGARLGSALLTRLPEVVLRWFFVGFMVLIAVVQFLVVPPRVATIPLDPLRALAVVGLGLGTGVLSGLLGVGGGLIAISALTALFGSSDLVARGTSLIMMIPGAVTGTVSNFRKGLVDLRVAALLALPAIVVTPAGAWLARFFSPRTNTILLGCYVLVIVARSVYVAWPKRGVEPPAEAPPKD